MWNNIIGIIFFRKPIDHFLTLFHPILLSGLPVDLIPYPIRH